MKTVILGCGYVGTALLGFWQESNQTLIGTTTSLARVKELSSFADKVVVLAGEEKEKLRNVIDGADRLVICVAPKRGKNYVDTYLKTAQNICSLIEEGCRVGHLVYTSTTSVYGDQKGAWVDEETPLSPIGDHGNILAGVEQLYLKLSSKNTLVTVLRLAGIYGPDREHTTRARRLAGQTVPGSGNHYSNWVHQEDVVRAINWTFKNSLTGIYNVCEDEHPTREELYGKFLEREGLPPIVWDETIPSIHGGHKRVSNKKLKETKFTFTHQL